MCVKTIFIFPHLVSDLDLYSFDLEIALQVTRHIGNLPSKFERRTEFCFWVNSWHETDRRMDGRLDGHTDECNVVSLGRSAYRDADQPQNQMDHLLYQGLLHQQI